MTAPTDPVNELSSGVQLSWHRFLELYEPLRPELYRYCRYLTKSPWDAEDLAQDALARAFVTLARMGEAPESARAFLFRVASNLWIDQKRRERAALVEPVQSDGETTTEPRSTREAAGTLLLRLAPQERAAVVLKDVFELSLEEAAEVLATSVGAVKAAISRGRGKLSEPEAVPERSLLPGALNAFCDAFNARDVPRLTQLLLDTSIVEVVSATEGKSARTRQNILHGMLFGSERLAEAATRGGIEARYVQGVLPSPPRLEARMHRGEALLLSWYQHTDIEAVRAITRVELDGERIAHLKNYFFNPEFIAEVCGELGLPFRVNGHRWWLTGC